jgi:hypothetical protein
VKDNGEENEEKDWDSNEDKENASYRCIESELINNTYLHHSVNSVYTNIVIFFSQIKVENVSPFSVCEIPLINESQNAWRR